VTPEINFGQLLENFSQTLFSKLLNGYFSRSEEAGSRMGNRVRLAGG
jgi:hypothetical protein